MSKLIRDKLPEFLEEQGTHLVYEQAPNEKRNGLLFAKLLEEAGEWLTATTTEERLKELGDLQEVIWALGESAGITPEEILMQAHRKQKLRGGFSELQTMKVELGPGPTSKTAPKRSKRAGGVRDVVANAWPGGRIPDVIAHESYAYSG